MFRPSLVLIIHPLSTYPLLGCLLQKEKDKSRETGNEQTTESTSQMPISPTHPTTIE